MYILQQTVEVAAMLTCAYVCVSIARIYLSPLYFFSLFLFLSLSLSLALFVSLSLSLSL